MREPLGAGVVVRVVENKQTDTSCPIVDPVTCQFEALEGNGQDDLDLQRNPGCPAPGRSSSE